VKVSAGSGMGLSVYTGVSSEAFIQSLLILEFVLYVMCVRS